MVNDGAGLASSGKTLRSVNLKEPLTVSPQLSVLEAARLMTAKNIDSVVVLGLSGTDDTPAGLRHPVLYGIVTVKDVTNRVTAKGLDPTKVTVSQVMTSPLQTVTLDTTLYKVVQLMNQNNFRQVPVVDQTKVVGMATSAIINASIINDILEDIKLIATIFK